MRIKPINTHLSETPWKAGQKVKVIDSDGCEGIYPLGKVFTLQEYGDHSVIPGGWNGYSAKLELVEEKDQLEFDL